MPLISRKKRTQGREEPAKLTRSGLPRRKPGPKPRTIDLTGSTTGQPTTLDRLYAAYDATPGDAAAKAAAWRAAMPPMTQVSIGEWASIVAHGVARRVLTGKEASTMLYAAQVAQTK